jgi:tubby-related protein 1
MFRSIRSFQVYNVSRGRISISRLSKAGGNFIGEMKSNAYYLDYSLLGADGKTELGAISERRATSSRNTTWPWILEPRRCHVILPALDVNRAPICTFQNGARGLQTLLQSLIHQEEAIPPEMFSLRTKDPNFDPITRSYRLNFHGRVTIPSVKNFQITLDSDPHAVVCQFGRVGIERFHLDFCRPFNAFQAFCLALTSFANHR